MCIAEKQLAVTNVDVGKVNLGAACANAFDFPAMEDEPCFVALLNGVVVSCALIQNARLGVFVEEAAGVELFIASQGGVSFLLDAEGQKLFVCADKAELPAKFVHLLK